MIKVITLDRDNLVVSEIEKPKGYRPRNGFRRLPNGNFVKVLGDPRNIRDIERAEEIKRKAEETKRQSEPKPTPSVYTPTVTQMTPIPDKGPKSLRCADGGIITQIVNYDGDSTYEDWRQCIKYNVATYHNFGPRFQRVSVRKRIGITLLDQVDCWERVELHQKLGIAKFWLKQNKSDGSDFVLRNAFKPLMPTII
jgi:hypothetical protein